MFWRQARVSRSKQDGWLAMQRSPAALFSEGCVYVWMQVWLNGNGQEQGQRQAEQIDEEQR